MMEEKQTETSQFKQEKLFFQLTQNILAKKKKKSILTYFGIQRHFRMELLNNTRKQSVQKE